MVEFKGIVYLTTNLLTGKKYIGQDSKNCPYYLGSGKLLTRAIKKYGREKFQKEILAYAKSQKDLEELEKYYIDYYSAQTSDTFYNIAPGGCGGKVSSHYQYREVPIYEINPETKEILESYNSSREAGKILGINWKVINGCINHQKKRAGGRFFCKQSEYSALNKKFSEERINRNIYLSYNTGIYYSTLKDAYDAEVSGTYSYTSFYKRFKGIKGLKNNHGIYKV